MTLVSLYLLIIILNVDGLNSPIKKHRVTGQIKKKKDKQDPTICYTLWDSLWPYNTCTLKVSGQERYFVQAETKWEQGELYLYQKKIDCKSKVIII